MADIRKLIAALAAQEEELCRTRFLAPCVGGGRVRVNVCGLIHTFKTKPFDFEGWGIFQPRDEHAAELVEKPGLSLVAAYLKLLTPLRVRLAHRLRGNVWLAYPVNDEDARQQCGVSREIRVHFVENSARFEQVLARTDGRVWLFEEADRRADPRIAERLRKLLRQVVYPPYITWKGITPEIRAVYSLATEFAPEFRRVVQRRTQDRLRQTEESRLRDALRMGGGELVEYRDQGDCWQVEWETSDGARHTSAISKRDLTVVSAGICLSDRDSDFDLQSLVGVMAEAWDY